MQLYQLPVSGELSSMEMLYGYAVNTQKTNVSGELSSMEIQVWKVPTQTFQDVSGELSSMEIKYIVWNCPSFE